ncbi:MAG: hypothetical protein ACRCXC_09985 [Legionella sp.]
MNKLLAKVGVFSLLMGVTLYGWAHGPCKAIAISCMQNGYYKGGEKEGKGMVKDCVMPVARGEKRLPNSTFSPTQLQECKANLVEKMKGKMQQKMQQQPPQQ